MPQNRSILLTLANTKSKIMIERLQEIIQQVATQAVGNDHNISNELAGNVAKETGSSVIDGLKSAISGGNLGDLTSMFNSGDSNSLTSNPVVQQIISSLTSKLGGSSIGLDSGAAGNFASSIIPKIISVITEKVKSGEFDVNGIMAAFSGGSSVLDQNGDGKVGLDDAISAVTKGGLGDVLGGFFK